MTEDETPSAPASGHEEPSASPPPSREAGNQKSSVLPENDGKTGLAIIEENISGESPGEAGEDSETSSSGTDSSSKKRKRRRKKSKKPGEEGDSESEDEETENREEEPRAPRPPKPQPPKPKLDPEAVADLACKIFLAEISEEGVALVDDQSAREISRRCFRLSEIFLEEQARRK